MKKAKIQTFLIVERRVLVMKKLNANDKLIYSLMNGFWHCGLEFEASNSYIADFLGIHRSSVIRSIQKLEALNLIRCEYSILNNGQDRKIISYGTYLRNERKEQKAKDKEQTSKDILAIYEYIKQLGNNQKDNSK